MIAVVLVSSQAASKTIIMVGPGYDFKRSSALFEASIIEVKPPKTADVAGTVVVEVSSDWRRVYRGFRHLGSRIEIPYRGTPLTNAFRVAMKQRAGRFLVAVDSTTDEVAYLGLRNASGSFGLRAIAPVPSRQLQANQLRVVVYMSGLRTGQAAEPVFRQMFWDERKAFLIDVATFLGTRRPPLTSTAVETLLTRLDAQDFTARDAAQAALGAAPLEFIPHLREYCARSTSLEVRRRLRRVLDRLQMADAHATADREIRARRSNIVKERAELGPRPTAQAKQLKLFIRVLGGIR